MEMVAQARRCWGWQASSCSGFPSLAVRLSRRSKRPRGWPAARGCGVLATRRARFPWTRVGIRAALFVDLRGEPLRRGGLQYLVEMALRAAGVGDRRSPGVLVRALRHTYATRPADVGASARKIMALLGHASLTTSQAYIDATASEERRSAAANRTYRALDGLLAQGRATLAERWSLYRDQFRRRT